MRSTRTILFASVVVVAGITFFWLSFNEEEELLGDQCLALSSSIAEAEVDYPAPTDYEAYADLGKPPLHPDEALERFQLVEGFRIEVVAHEPMVVDPVAMDIDADGRLWVVNMPAYNSGPVREILETTGERTEEREQALRDMIPDAPAGEVVILEDTNGDGVMDTRRVFYEGVMLPRAIKVLKDGILLGEPPNLWFIQDTNGDGRGDSREQISNEYATPRSPQSGPSALFWAMNNWMHNSHFPSLRRVDGAFQTRAFEPLGQWDMTQDDWGRLYSSSNSWPLQSHLVPYGYSDRHPLFDVSAGLNVTIAPNQPIWPAHPTGVNRGYQVGDVTREDGTIRRGAGISSTVIYRGNQFGDEYRGDAFTPVGGGNLISRIQIDSDPAEIEAEGRFAYEDREFLTSTDERFRPVNIYNAPDGSVYVIDLYRGLYDYVLWVTDYLAEYSLEHGLEEPTGMFGRIYRVVREDAEIDYHTPRFSELTPREVVDYLRHSNGHLRDQAQQTLVQCSPDGVASEIARLVRDGSELPQTRLQALWTLEGLERNTFSGDDLTDVALDALDDDHPRVRAAALRILEPALAENNEAVLDRLDALTDSESALYVQLQLVASLGGSDSERALHLMASLLNDHPDSDYFREMALTGVYHREEQFASILREEFGWDENQGEGYEALLANLREAVEERPDRDLDHLSAAHKELYEMGEMRYPTCAACHGAQGEGVGGIGSRLAGSEWVQGDADALIRIVLQGFDGGAAERGENIPNDMPGHGFLSDEEVAAILTFMRQSWGNESPPIDPEDVANVRAETSDRTELWSPDELRAIPE